MVKIFRFKDFAGSEVSRLRREIARLKNLNHQLSTMLDHSCDEVVDLKFSLEEATGVPQN